MSATLDRVTGSATVSTVNAEPTLCRRLAEMGVRPGAHIRVLHRTSGGGRVIAVGGARLALDAKMAAVITVDGDR